ncbi:MAG TPA: AMP-binding protein [Burkholderiales bacterium]|nr:AMP-binding protein [Burkholderiales bacterium]
MNLSLLLHAAATCRPGAPAVTQGSLSWRYGELSRRVAGTAAYLRGRLSAQPGERIGIAMHNSPGTLQLMYGCWHAGLCAVPINAKLHPREFAFILEHSGVRACFASPSLYPGIRREWTADRASLLEADAALIERLAQAPPMPPHQGQPDDPAWLFYTSGTTGRPKGATLTQRNLLFATHAYYADIDPLDERDTVVHAAPLSHGSGLYSLPHIAKGSHNVITASESFTPGDLFDAIERYLRVSFFAAPTMLMRLVNDGAAAQAQLANLKTVIYGGGPMHVPDLVRALALFGPRLYQLYGQGESPMTITGLSQRDHERALAAHDHEALASAGGPRTGVAVRIVDEADRDLPDGEVGEIVTRSDCVMQGYWRDPAATEAALRGGWLRTGDVGCRDGRGWFTLKDRSKDMIISGGSNIYPREIEDVLLRHARVAQASVVGAPQADWGEEVVAFVVPAAGAAVTAEELDRLCLEHIARYKRPRRYVFVEDLPKNNYGKVLKTALRARLRGEAADS